VLQAEIEKRQQIHVAARGRSWRCPRRFQVVGEPERADGEQNRTVNAGVGDRISVENEAGDEAAADLFVSCFRKKFNFGENIIFIYNNILL